MATTVELETLLGEIAHLTVKRTSDEDVSTAAGLFARQFKSTDYGDVAGAFDAWLAKLGDRAPQALPTPAMIWAQISEERKREPDRRAMATSAYIRPGTDFVKQQKTFRAELEKILIGGVGRSVEDAGVDGKHEHTEPVWDAGVLILSGREECGRCNRGGNRLERLEELYGLELVPMDFSSGNDSPSDCRGCDGSGMVDTKEAHAAVMSARAEFREVYPCRVCNQEAFDAWLAEWRTPDE